MSTQQTKNTGTIHPIVEYERNELLAYLAGLPPERQLNILRMAKTFSDNDVIVAMALALNELKAKVKQA